MGQSPDSSSYNENGIGLPLIQGNADITNGFSSPKRYTSKPTKVCDTNDILLTVRAPVGSVAIASKKSCIGRGVCSIKAEKYVYYFLQSKEHYWKTIAQGSTFTCISSDDITKLVCNYPNESGRRKTEHFLSAIDERIAIQSKIIKEKKCLLKHLNDLLYERSDKRLYRFSDVSETFNGLSGKTAEDFGEGSPFITYLNVLNNRIVSKNEYGYVTVPKEEHQNVVKYGDVLLTLSSETPEEVGVASVYLGNEKPIYLNSFSLGLRFFRPEAVEYKYLPWLFATNAFRKHIYPFAQGSTRYNLNVSSFMNSYFEIPVYENQKEYSNIIELMVKDIETNNNLLTKYREMKEYLLSALFI